MRKHFKVLIAILLVIGLAAFTAVNASAGEYWKKKVVRFSATAGATLTIGDVVYVDDLDSYVYKADANDSTKRPACGVIGKGGASGSAVEVIVIGVLAGQTAASAGLRLFLSETAGAFTTTAPTNEQGLGFIMPSATSGSTSQTYFISIQTPDNNGAGY